jgi:hypothetical protein
MSSNRITVLILAIAAVAIVAVLTAGGGMNLPSLPSLPSIGGGGGDDSEQVADARPADPPGVDGEKVSEDEPQRLKLPANLDDVRGTDSYALTRPANLRRALRLLERRRRRVNGVFDGLRIAPGRIDTVIVRPDDRRTNLQIRPDMVISFENTIDFPTETGFRKGGLSARDVPVRRVGRLLRAIDRRRDGSAARDVDYVVVGKDIIDYDVEVMAYMRVRTPRPRYWRLEGGSAVAFG